MEGWVDFAPKPSAMLLSPQARMVPPLIDAIPPLSLPISRALFPLVPARLTRTVPPVTVICPLESMPSASLPSSLRRVRLPPEIRIQVSSALTIVFSSVASDGFSICEPGASPKGIPVPGASLPEGSPVIGSVLSAEKGLLSADVVSVSSVEGTPSGDAGISSAFGSADSPDTASPSIPAVCVTAEAA